MLLKSLSESDLMEFISQFSKLMCGRYWFLSEFCCWKFKQIAKIGSGRKNQLSAQCVHIAEFRNFEFGKCEKIKNVFTLGPTAQATVHTSRHDFLSSVSFGLLEKAKNVQSWEVHLQSRRFSWPCIWWMKQPKTKIIPFGFGCTLQGRPDSN